MSSKKAKLTTRTMEQLAKSLPADDVWDTELSGFHVRPGKRGMTFRLYYRTKTGQRRMLTCLMTWRCTACATTLPVNW